ncbi:unnamed protein product [Heligmosomoides polygyrus]|uniref:RRM domain-containing protein n=1 Tax=Heligmosomoides polygyrus TaxID=6339 RepID=A0A183F9T4_HELPZ|nr:unnamed protein product [Heligmosomoides polygyrus]
MKEKLLQQKREKREEKRKIKAAMKQQKARRRRKNDAVGENESVSKNMAISCSRYGILPLVDLSVFWRIFVPGKVFLNRWLVLDEIPSHRYGVIAYLVVEKSEAATEILEIACESGYTFRNMEMSHFHLDVRTRRLFLNNACEVVKSTELMDINLKDGRALPHNYWRGGPEYAPLSWHNKGQRKEIHPLEIVTFACILSLDVRFGWVRG